MSRAPPKEFRLSNSTKEPKNAKVRVFALAKELDVETKALLEYCKELGFAGITNQLHGLDPDQADALKDRSKKGSKAHSGPAAHAPTRPAQLPPPTKIEAKIQTIPKAKPTVKPAEPVAPVSVAAPPVVVEPIPQPVVETAPPPAPEPTPAPVAEVVAVALSDLGGSDFAAAVSRATAPVSIGPARTLGSLIVAAGASAPGE